MNSAKLSSVCVISGMSCDVSACSRLRMSSSCCVSLSSVQHDTNAALNSSLKHQRQVKPGLFTVKHDLIRNRSGCGKCVPRERVVGLRQCPAGAQRRRRRLLEQLDTEPSQPLHPIVLADASTCDPRLRATRSKLNVNLYTRSYATFYNLRRMTS